jgi:hypothetical protein
LILLINSTANPLAPGLHFTETILSQKGETMKPGNLLLMVLVLLLGTAVAAPAVTLHTPWKSCQKEESLYQIISAWGFPVDYTTLQHATPLESLPAGTYVMSHYAIGRGKSQPRGFYPWAITPPGCGDQPPADGIQLLIPKQSGNWACDIAFTETSEFGFFETSRKGTILLTTQNHLSAIRPYHQLSGLIFDLGEIDPLYCGQYIVVFEDGRWRHPFCRLDYHDLVIHVEAVPLPGTLPLVGGGLLCLLIPGFYQRLFASAG